MNQRKQNMSRWYTLGLAVMLAVGCLVMSVGVSWARYRTETDRLILFQPRAPLHIRLGTMIPGENETTVFAPTDQAVWISYKDRTQLDAVVANGSAADDFEARTQKFHVRLVGTIGTWSGDETAAIRILKPGATVEEPAEPEQPTEQTEQTRPAQSPWAEATVVRIQPETALYHSFGDGWVFCFVDEISGRELTWTLEGGQLSCQELCIVIDNGTLTDTSLLQLQIVDATGLD